MKIVNDITKILYYIILYYTLYYTLPFIISICGWYKEQYQPEQWKTIADL